MLRTGSRLSGLLRFRRVVQLQARRSWKHNQPHIRRKVLPDEFTVPATTKGSQVDHNDRREQVAASENEVEELDEVLPGIETELAQETARVTEQLPVVQVGDFVEVFR